MKGIKPTVTEKFEFDKQNESKLEAISGNFRPSGFDRKKFKKDFGIKKFSSDSMLSIDTSIEEVNPIIMEKTEAVYGGKSTFETLAGIIRLSGILCKKQNQQFLNDMALHKLEVFSGDCHDRNWSWSYGEVWVWKQIKVLALSGAFGILVFWCLMQESKAISI